MKAFLIIILLINANLNFGQDTTNINIRDYLAIDNHSNTVLNVLNIDSVKYKVVLQKDSIEYYITSNGQSKIIDTIIYIGFDKESTDTNAWLINQYYRQYIESPGHGGDPNYSIVSFVIDAEGKVVTINILKDVENHCCEEDWIVPLINDYMFIPIKGQTAEYIVHMWDIQYCVPLIYKDGGQSRLNR